MNTNAISEAILQFTANRLMFKPLTFNLLKLIFTKLPP